MSLCIIQGTKTAPRNSDDTVLHTMLAGKSIFASASARPYPPFEVKETRKSNGSINSKICSYGLKLRHYQVREEKKNETI